jgi:SAM-dependent methyltransferase
VSSSINLLSAAEHALLNRCIAWHVRPHRQAFLDGLITLSKSLRFDDLSVLEIGATAQSTLSPFLVARGANSTVTCYSKEELPKLAETVSHLAQDYRLARERLHVRQADIFALDRTTRFDLILLKDVLGGVNRQHDHADFCKAVSNCLSILNPNGQLLIIDKGHSLKVIHWILKKWGSAGKNEWHYFTFDELRQLIPQGVYETSFAAYGILSFGDFGGGILQQIADFLDEYFVEKLVPLEERVVFSLTCIAKLKVVNLRSVGWDNLKGDE